MPIWRTGREEIEQFGQIPKAGWEDLICSVGRIMMGSRKVEAGALRKSNPN
jgi:hypothetical protein